jgi:hypothetical protein
LHLLRAKTLLLLDLEMAQRLSRRLGVRIVHAHYSFHRVSFTQGKTRLGIRDIVARSLCDGVVRKGVLAQGMSRLRSRR